MSSTFAGQSRSQPKPQASEASHAPERLLSAQEAEQAAAAKKALGKLVNKCVSGKDNAGLVEMSSDERLEIPLPALKLLVTILGEMADGYEVIVTPSRAELTTQEAADFLNVSRPFVARLVDSKQLPARKVGNRRRIRAEDLLRYKRKDDQQRAEAMDALAAESQALGLDY